ncbi:uncharacterized protein L969DRAFT_42749 [Mixia osmundae IAM 14324]|uniref:Uncharacterized protein n=1 Tax=Mixia osmundae (strain CBS 9802 / IAM 14324 / JCM 22182 / KY 12970) TaxID=764103 RepID=G7DSS6_MIXOS|nr:uncharacterized protein L969DRAFT_42749 [Mixia osmundae IAM 14324]KEI41818.1 hypothetical protein L969DRAFT_42749 [Mixia osmundae IAM 14324]GAA93634.1 hypothetical protein E5Q_00278 [Mixia osmundae IAM 14324]
MPRTSWVTQLGNPHSSDRTDLPWTTADQETIISRPSKSLRLMSSQYMSYAPHQISTSQQDQDPTKDLDMSSGEAQQKIDTIGQKVDQGVKSASQQADKIASDPEGHANSLLESASKLASDTIAYAKQTALGAQKDAEGAAKDAKSSADGTQLPGNTTQTLGGLIDEARNVAGQALGEAQKALSHGQQQAASAADDAKARKSGGESYVDQAKSLAASALGTAQSYIAVGQQKAEQAQADGKPQATLQDATDAVSKAGSDIYKAADQKTGGGVSDAYAKGEALLNQAQKDAQPQ